MKSSAIPTSSLKPNPSNPRQSIKDFPEMMEKRPMVCVTNVDGKLFPYMRLKAIQELGYKDWIL